MATQPYGCLTLTGGDASGGVYRKEKFHAKAYISHAKQAVVGSSALGASTNFTSAGLINHVALNVQITARLQSFGCGSVEFHSQPKKAFAP